jgi:16S rRNA (guanine966-N2)-methyltransferase
MRIVSGIHKGKRLQAPKNLPVRPTTDMAKEALFNILQNRIDFNELSVLDLFSGTGNISFEFASRGASNITCVDAHHACVKYIQKTSDELSFKLKVIKSDVFKFLDKSSGLVDIIFADPPYDFEKHQLEKLVNTTVQKGWLSTEGSLIIEHSKHMDLSDLSHFEEARKYGGSVFSFFRLS